MTALDRLQGDVARVIDQIANENWPIPPEAMGAIVLPSPVFTSEQRDYLRAHVSERVMAMLTEEWGLIEEREMKYPKTRTPGQTPFRSVTERRLTTRWTTDDAAREGGEQP